MNNTKTLLNKIETIIQNQKKSSFEHEDDYNIFKALRLERDEEKLHSRFIADLINPKGHNKNWDLFIKQFLSEVLNKGIKSQSEKIHLIQEKTSIKTEKDIGKITDDYSEGGRIDIYITDGTTHIAIETKIDAGDQKHQLFRYQKFLSKVSRNSGNYYLFYLTLNGHIPSKQSVECKGIKITENIYLLSFSNHIFNWLESCLKVIGDNLNLNSSIKQYLNLLENVKMENEINEEIMQHIAESRAIWSLFEKTIKAKRKEIMTQIISYLTNDLKHSYVNEIDDNSFSISSNGKKYLVNNFSYSTEPLQILFEDGNVEKLILKDSYVHLGIDDTLQEIVYNQSKNVEEIAKLIHNKILLL